MQICQQLLASCRRISQPKVFARLIREPALVQIFLCLDATPVSEKHIIKFCRLFIDFEKPQPPALTPFCLLRVLWLRKRYPRFLRKYSQGFGKCTVLIFHHKRDHITALAAAKALVDLPRAVHRKGWGLLPVKRAAAHIVYIQLSFFIPKFIPRFITMPINISINPSRISEHITAHTTRLQNGPSSY